MATQESGQGAGRTRGVAAKRRTAKAPGVVSQPGVKKRRVQFHLSEQTVERLGVHRSLVHKNESKIVDEILSSYLCRHGRGRQIFPPGPESVEPEGLPDTLEDRQEMTAA